MVLRVMVPYVQVRDQRVPGTVELAVMRSAGFDLRRDYEKYIDHDLDALVIEQTVDEVRSNVRANDDTIYGQERAERD